MNAPLETPLYIFYFVYRSLCLWKGRVHRFLIRRNASALFRELRLITLFVPYRFDDAGARPASDYAADSTRLDTFLSHLLVNIMIR